MYNASGELITEYAEDLPQEEGDPVKNNEKRFRKVRHGLDLVLEPIETSEEYFKHDNSGGMMERSGDRMEDESRMASI